MAVKTAWNFHIFSLFLLHLTVASLNSAEILTVYSNSNLEAPSMAVSVENQDLNEVANSVLMAETWLRKNVLPFYPAYKITHIVVGHNLLCSSKNYHQMHHLFLPALKNIHHSLTRWNLHSEIKVSPSISSHCLELSSDLSSSLLKNLLNFINSTNSSYMVNPSLKTPISDTKFETLISTHLKTLKKIGFLSLENLKFMVISDYSTKKETKPTMRKLSYVLPTPSPEELPIGKGPYSLPPLIGVGPTNSPPSPIFSGAPHLGLSPSYSPDPHPQPHLHPHHHHYWAPCNPAPPKAAPGPRAEPSGDKMWCVAKPSVPAETLQEAMDYACGVGGAECDEIQPNGNCYNPDTIVAHASFAFNSYWQKTKVNGGSCSFGGTAMLINSDPSFLQCRFIVS